MSEAAVEAPADNGAVDVEQTLAEPGGAASNELNSQPADDKPDTGESKQEKDWEAEAAKWRSLARKHENTAKQNAEAARKFAEYEDSQKSELQRLQERAEAAERERDEERRTRARLMAAAAHNLSADLLDRLGGASEEEINETAEVISKEIESEVARRLPDLVEAEVARRLAEMPKQEPPTPLDRRRPVEALTPGAMPAHSQPEDGNDFLRRMAGRS